MSESDLTLYKPTADISQVFSVDETLPDNELAFDLLKKLTVARKIQDATFIAIGKMLKIVRDKKLYKKFDFENFSQFLASEELSFSREKAYAYIRIYEIFVERLVLDPNEISKLGVVRLMMLAPVIKGIEDRDEAIAKIEESKDLRYNDFVREVKSQTNRDGRPTVYWSEETEKWIVNFFEDTTTLVPMGKFKENDT